MIDPVEFVELSRRLKAAAHIYELSTEGHPETLLIAHVELSEARQAFFKCLVHAFEAA